jgi:leader peptidase (prepilin peptidase) / N-methyltransferase
MFNLEQSIADWRKQMLAAGIKTPVPLEELESHLREEIEEQIQSGIGEQQAFETTVLQMGRAMELKTEFAKNDEAKRKAICFFLPAVFFAACWFLSGQSPAMALVYCVFLTGLAAASFIDFEHLIIPDKITFGGLFIGLFCSALLPQLHGQRFVIAGIFQSLLGVGTGAALVYFILRTGKFLFGRERIALGGEGKIIFTDTAVYLPKKRIPYEELFHRRSDAIEMYAQSIQAGNRSYKNVSLRLAPDSVKIGDDIFSPTLVPHMEAVGSEIILPREAMGMGDVKFMAAIGAFIGWQGVVFSLIASSLIGSCVGMGLIAAQRREWSSRLPYGPYIALAAAIWIFGGSKLLAKLFGQ